MRLLRAGTIGVSLFLVCVTQSVAQRYSSNIDGSYRVRRNLTYATLGTWEGKLDVFSRTDQPGPHPTIVWIHGGSSVRGEKDSALFNFAILTYLEWGWNVVNVEHRVPGVTLAPAALQNCQCALRWVVENASEHGIDADRLVVGGASSGGWFALAAAMAPLSEGWDEPCPGTKDAKVAAVVNWFGVTDLVDVLRGPNAKSYAAGWIRGLPNPIEVAKSVSPMTFVGPNAPPVVSVHGDADTVVPYSHSVRLHEALREAGVPERLVTIAGAPHGLRERAQNQTAYAAIREFLADNGFSAEPLH